MFDQESAAALSAGYVCPPEAGPAWRKAVEDGIDMSLVERNISRSPWERLLAHDQAWEFAQALRNAGRNRA